MPINSLNKIHALIQSCRACPNMVGPPVHGIAVDTRIVLLGQAPGPREGSRGRPFAHTAGVTLFRWFNELDGIDETRFRNSVYIAAVARCFPGKAKGGADRVPDASEIRNCGKHLRKEMEVLKPKLVLAVGKLAISEVLGPEVFGPSARLVDVVGTVLKGTFHGQTTDVICLPHPSGLSSWHKVEPGRSLLHSALQLVRNHPEWRRKFHDSLDKKEIR